MVGVTRLANSQQADRIRPEPRGGPLEQREGGSLADGDAVARDIKRPAGSGRGQLQRMKAVQSREAQRIDAAHDGGVDEVGLEHAPRAAEHFRARGTG